MFSLVSRKFLAMRNIALYSVHLLCIFWEGHKILRNLHLTFLLCSKYLVPLPVKSKVKISQDFVAFSEYKTYRHVGRGEAGEAYAPQILSPPKVVENTRYPLMKHHISSWLFSKFDDFLSFVIYVVRWSLSNKKIAFSTDIEHNGVKKSEGVLVISCHFFSLDLSSPL